MPFGNMEPRTRAVLAMGLASSIHFASYELARSATLALFTSKRSGFTSPAATPLAIGLVSPISIALLWIYTRWLDQKGPRYALWNTALLFATVLGGSGLLLGWMDPPHQQPIHPLSVVQHTISQITLLILFCLQNALVNLLFTQHWSFLSSALTAQEAAVWFAPMAGVGSFMSTAAAMAVKPLVACIGLIPLLLVASFLLLLCATVGDDAYRIAHENGFAPKPSNNNTNTKSSNNSNNDNNNNNKSHSGKMNLRAVWALFQRRPILGALCFEVLSCQCLSSLITFLFMLKLKESIPNDETRAGWSGKCYGWINAASGVLQFAILPYVFKHWVDPSQCWMIMPCAMLACVTLLYAPQQQPTNESSSSSSLSSLSLVATSFFVMKTLEYSVRGVATEMVYVSLDYESRFLGKEIIGTVVNRFGKSGMSLALSLVTAWFGSAPWLDQCLMVASQVCALLWLVASLRLSKLLTESKTAATATTKDINDKDTVKDKTI